MDQAQLEQLAKLVADRLQASALATIDPDEHARHHAAIDLWIDRENRRREVWEKVKASVIGWVLIAVLGGIGIAVFDYFAKLIKRVANV